MEAKRTLETYSHFISNKMGYNTGMRLGFGKNSGKLYVAIDSNPIQHRRSSYLR